MMNCDIDNLLSANIVLTSNCNSRCKSCDYWRHKGENLSLEKIKYFFEILKKYNTESIVLTGGEPTLHPQFYKILEMAKCEYGFITILSTNGTTIPLIFEKVCDLVDSFCISFDGATPEEYAAIRGIDNFQNIMTSIHRIKSYNSNIQVWLSCLIQRMNFDHLESIYDTALQSEADGIFFNVPELKPGCFGRNEAYSPSREMLISVDSISLLERIFLEIQRKDTNTHFLCQSASAFENFVEYFKVMNNLVKPKCRKCYVPYNTITLTETGQIKPCFYIDYAMELTADPVNSPKMKAFRSLMHSDKTVQEQCDYCGQFNS